MNELIDTAITILTPCVYIYVALVVILRSSIWLHDSLEQFSTNETHRGAGVNDSVGEKRASDIDSIDEQSGGESVSEDAVVTRPNDGVFTLPIALTVFVTFVALKTTIEWEHWISSLMGLVGVVVLALILMKVQKMKTRTVAVALAAIIGFGGSSVSHKRADLLERSAPPSGAELESLIEALKAEVADDQYSTSSIDQIEAIASVGPGVIPKIVPFLSDSNPNIRAAGADIISKLGPAAEEAIPVMLDALRKSAEKQSAAGGHNRPTREMKSDFEIQHALSSIGPAAIPPVIAEMDSENKHYLTSLVDILARIEPVSDVAIDGIIKALNDKPEVKYTALHALGEIGEPARKAVPSLVKHLNGENHDLMRISICESLWKIDKNTKQTVPVLMALLSPKSGVGARASAARLLSMIGPPAKAAIPGLRVMLADRSRDLHLYAAEALWKIDGNAAELIPVLMEVLKDKSPRKARLRPKAARILGQMGPAAKEVVPFLIELSKSKVEDSRVRSDAYKALIKIDREAAAEIKNPR